MFNGSEVPFVSEKDRSRSKDWEFTKAEHLLEISSEAGVGRVSKEDFQMLQCYPLTDLDLSIIRMGAHSSIQY